MISTFNSKLLKKASLMTITIQMLASLKTFRTPDLVR
jgi:hypothetical protein